MKYINLKDRFPDYKSLGYMNGWRVMPPEFEKCRAHGHKRLDESIGTHERVIWCPDCKIYFCVDSS